MCSVQDEREHSVWIGGGEQNAHRSAFRDAKQRRPFRTGRVHDSADIVHALLTARSDIPVPRLSKKITRENDDNC
jgi:hypothetical protein